MNTNFTTELLHDCKKQLLAWRYIAITMMLLNAALIAGRFRKGE